MDHGSVPQPGRLTARYEGLSGGREQRLFYYLARRYLGLTPAGWDALAWWEQKAYLEGFEEEGLISSAGTGGRADPTLVDEKVRKSGNTTVIDRKHEATFSMIPGEMAAFGIPERTI